MNIEDFLNVLKHTTINTKVHWEQFFMWLNKLFYLNEKLHKEYHSIIMSYFYVVLAEIVSTGSEYINNVYNDVKNSPNEKIFKVLKDNIPNLIDNFDENEVSYLFYRRDDACHIFTNSYEIEVFNDKIKKERKKQSIDDIRKKLMQVIENHGGIEENVNKYFLHTLYPKIHSLQLTLKNVT